MKISDQQKEILLDYFSEEEPFGPINAAEIDDPKVLQLIFEQHNKLYRALKKRPSIVVGRKGAGKTSYLHSVFFEGVYDYKIELSTAKALSSVIEAIGSMRGGAIFAESVAEIWENVLYTGAFPELRNQLPKKSRARKLINDYLAKIGLRDGGTFDDVLWHMADIFSEKAESNTVNVVAEILRVLANNDFKKAYKALCDELNSNNKRAVILLDSLDDFQLELDDVSRAIQGLLKRIGESNKPSNRIDIRFCLPAELFHVFVPLSSNPNKDFKRKILLHWVASELVMLAAHRLTLYSNLEIEGLPEEINDIDITNKNSAQKLLQLILPDKVECRLGVDEDALGYILRHTQLLPRHLLIILNSICDKNRKNGNSNGTLVISEDAVRKGVREVEDMIVQEIFVAFEGQYPLAKVVCEGCIPELHNKFTQGDLERVFRQEGKKLFQSDEFDDFQKMLIEIGAIGRVLDDKGRYIQGQFEYTVPYKLVTSTDDLLCIHPLFSEIYNAKIRDRKPVYPYGSRVEDRDLREV